MSKSVLIIDDDPVVRHILSSILAGLGYVSTQAANGKEGLATLQSVYGAGKGAAAEFCAAFIDLMLLDIPGTQIAIEVKTNLSPELPVILISANSEIEIKQLQPDARYDAFLPKPFDGNDVLAVMTMLSIAA